MKRDARAHGCTSGGNVRRSAFEIPDEFIPRGARRRAAPEASRLARASHRE